MAQEVCYNINAHEEPALSPSKALAGRSVNGFMGTQIVNVLTSRSDSWSGLSHLVMQNTRRSLEKTLLSFGRGGKYNGEGIMSSHMVPLFYNFVVWPWCMILGCLCTIGGPHKYSNTALRHTEHAYSIPSRTKASCSVPTHPLIAVLFEEKAVAGWTAYRRKLRNTEYRDSTLHSLPIPTNNHPPVPLFIFFIFFHEQSLQVWSALFMF